MIFKSPQFFFLTLGLLTLLGAAIGYCVAAIRERRIAKDVIDKLKLILVQEQHAAVSDLVDARKSIKRLHEMSKKVNGSAIQTSHAGNKSPMSAVASVDALASENALTAGTEDIPTLARRVNNVSGDSKDEIRGDSPVNSAPLGESVPNNNILKMSLPNELEIPELSESEFSESLSDLEPELSGIDGKETGRRG